MTTLHDDRARLIAAHEDAAELYRRMLLGPAGEGPRSYLADRGFSALLEDTRWTVGYAPPDWTRLRDHLLSLGYHDETLLAAGLTRAGRRGTPIDCFRDRITFGIRDLDGSLVGFTARTRPAAPAHVPKYLNTRATAIYDKSKLLFGLGEAAKSADGRPARTVVLTEGPLDAIAVDLVGSQDAMTKQALALCGTTITPSHRAALATLRPTRISLALDGDEPGARARENAYRLFRGVGDINAPNSLTGADPAEILRSDGPDALADLFNSTRPAIDLIVDARLALWPNRSQNAEAAIACLRSIAQLMNDLKPDDMAHQAARLRDRTGLPTPVVTRELADAIAPNIRDAIPHLVQRMP